MAQLRTLVRRALLRAVLFVAGRGWRSRVDMMQEIRRNRGGSLGVVHHRDDDWLVECGDHMIWCASSDRLIAAGLAKHGAWQRDDLEHALAALADAGVNRRGWFIDVGANIGTHVVYAALRSEIDNVLAIEPEPRNFDFIKRNVDLNNLSDRVTAVQLAITDTPGNLHLEINEALQGRHSVRGGANERTISVPALPLDHVLREQGISPDQIAMVWIDVESHEHAVFKGMNAILDAKVPVFFEYARKSVSEDVREAWRLDIENRYDRAFVVRPEGAREVSFAEAFEQGFADILIC